MSTVIKVENLSKQYRLGEISTGAISHDINRWWHKIRGKENPYLKIGEANDRTAKGQSDYVWSLKDINFEIEQGDAVGIIGRNGAGKSTLLKILSKVTQPTTGTIKTKGRIASLLEVGTGFHPELSGRDNIFLNGAILGMRKAEIKKKFDEIVDFAGVERYIDTPVKRYSSGMYVRLAFAVAAYLESEILIVDEVLAVGDAEFQKKCLGKMGELSKNEGRTVLFVSHQMGTIAQLCKKAILLSNGNIEKQGFTNEVINHYVAMSRNLDAGNNGSGYLVEDNNTKKIYFKHFYLSNSNNEIKTSFGFNENIVCNLKINENIKSANVKIGVALTSKLKQRVFTIVNDLCNLDLEKNIQLVLPSNLIAPNDYSFTIAIFIHQGETFEIIEDVVDLNIVDTGTELSIFEGLDFGNIIVDKYKWI
jgi:lipopolysaccharide transport system ATP-binding protein